MKKRIYLPIIVSSLLTFSVLSTYLSMLSQTPTQVVVEENVMDIDKVASNKKEENCEHERKLHFERVEPTLNKPGHIEFYYCCDCYKSFYDFNCAKEIPNSDLGLDNKLDGRYLSPITGTFSLLSQNIKDYLNAKEDADIIEALRNKSSYNDQAKRTIVWQSKNAPFVVEVSEDRMFSDFYSYETDNNVFTFEGIFTPGQTYYYRVKDANNAYILDDLSFRIDDTYLVRLLKVDGISNMRDIGGWSAKDGKKVLYGKFFRGANLSSVSESGKEAFLGKLGIKTEIDLRQPNDDAKQSLVDERLNYQNCPIWAYTRIIPDYEVYSDEGNPLGFDDATPAGIKKIFDLLANENNYPFYAHCAAGADRTGTIVYLINALLGVSYEDLTKDFELTTFSVQGDRYRSDVDEETMTFTNKGMFRNLTAIWGRMHSVLLTKYGTGNGKLYSAVENYLKTVCNVSDETIASVRLNMLGEVVDFSD